MEQKQKKYMTVPEMGNLLGLKKTDRYWLVHKNYFETKELLGQLRVNVASFEKWYANQVKYHKINGEEPGRELKERSYSPRELAELLDIHESVVYDLIKRNHIETILVDYWKRVPKEAFEQWYHSQSRYRTKTDRERDAEAERKTVSMPGMARILGIERKGVYMLLKSKKYQEIFDVVVVADRRRITKASLERFIEIRTRDHILSADTESDTLQRFRRAKQALHQNSTLISNAEYLTVEEAAAIAEVDRWKIMNWIERDFFTAKRVGNIVRIQREEYLNWLNDREEGH